MTNIPKRTILAGVMLLMLTGLITPFQGCSAERNSGEETTTRTEQKLQTPEPVGVPITSNDTTDKRVDTGSVALSQTLYIVEDTATSAALRLYIVNTSRQISLIDHVKPSCGCIMTTVQRSKARPGDSAEIYIGLLPEEMSRTQPYTVDVYMTTSPDSPLRLTIWKREAYENR